MLTGSDEQEVTSIVAVLLRYICVSENIIRTTRLQGILQQQFLEVRGSKACWDIPSKGINTLLYLRLPTMIKETKCLTYQLEVPCATSECVPAQSPAGKGSAARPRTAT